MAVEHQETYCDLTLSLPREIWTLISSHLPSLPDFIHFGAVCKLFRSVTTSSPHPIRPHSWLFLPHSDSLSFFSLTEQQTYHLPPLPQQLLGSHCVGSSHGWLILVSLTLRVHLFHPFSQIQYLLPPLPSSPMEQIYPPHTLRSHILNKATLSSDPEDNSCIIVAIHGFSGKLFSCRPGSPSWSPFPDPFGTFFTILHFRDNKFYAMSAQVDVTVCDFDSNGVSISLLQNGPTIFPNYLFDFDGDLLFIERERVIFRTDDESTCCTTSKIRVLKMDNDSGEWSETESIGGRSLFLKHDQVMPLPIGEFPVCEKDFIYFVDYCFGVGGTIMYLQMGKCDLMNGSILPLEQREPFEQLLVPSICFTPILRADIH